MLDGNKFILERPGLFLGPREHGVDRLRDVHLRCVDAARDLRQALKLPLDGELHRAWRDVQLVEQARHNAVFLAEERGKEMPRFHLVVREASSNSLRVSNRLTRHDGKFVEVHGFTSCKWRANPLIKETSPAGVSTTGQAGRLRDVPARPEAHRTGLEPPRPVSAGPPFQNEKPTSDAAVQKSYYIPYAYTFHIHRADRGLIGRKVSVLKQRCRQDQRRSPGYFCAEFAACPENFRSEKCKPCSLGPRSAVRLV